MNALILSDRERLNLHGPVKSVVDEYSTTKFDRDGKILEWSGNTSHGRVERKYVYDDRGRLLRIPGSNGDWVDEVHYDERGQKTRIRTVPSRADRGRHAFGIGAAFDAVAEGETPEGVGTVETTYNERGQPVEARILDDEGMVLARIAYTYDADGRLSQEKLTTENPPLPKAFRDQIPVEHRAAAIEQMKTQLAETSQRTGLFGDAVRTYAYDEQGRLAERHMRRGPIGEDISLRYNEHGDISESTRTTNPLPSEFGGHTEPALRSSNVYEYDEYGNWRSRQEKSEYNGHETTHSHIRELTFYS
jgi:hypothetical protein